MKYVDKIVIEENGQLLRIPIEEFVVADHINSIIRGYQYVLSFGSDEVVFQEASLREQFVEMLVHNGYEEENARSFKKRKQVSVLLRDYTVDHLFSEGLASVQRDGKYGFINQQGIEVIPCQYNYDSLFNEGFALVEENSKKMLIDREGNPLRLQILLQSLEDVTKISSGSVIEGTKVSYLLDFDNDVVSFSSEEERDNFLEAYENVTSIEKPKQMIKQKKR